MQCMLPADNNQNMIQNNVLHFPEKTREILNKAAQLMFYCALKLVSAAVSVR